MARRSVIEMISVRFYFYTGAVYEDVVVNIVGNDHLGSQDHIGMKRYTFGRDMSKVHQPVSEGRARIL